MDSLHQLFSRLAGLLRRRRLEAEMAEEMRQHLERRTQEKLAEGLTPDEARYAARREFGGMAQVQEQCRDERRFVWLEQVVQDVRYAARSLRKTPGFTVVIVLTLALGIGANTAIFSAVNAVLLRPLPYHQPDRLVSVDYLLGGEYLVLKDYLRTVQEIALYRPADGFNLSDDGEVERLTGARVSANLFSTLGISAVLGRTFRPDEDQPGQSAVVVLSHRLWRQSFGADISIIGRKIRVDGEPHTVVGVMPSSFNFPSAGTQLWLPYTFDRSNAGALWGGAQGGRVVARLAHTATSLRVQAEMRATAPLLREANTLWVVPAEWGANREVVLLQNRLVGHVRTRLLAILGTVGFVLLIACTNVVSLLLARASARRQEVAIRHSLGASRGRIVRQFLTESALLGLLGSTAGLLLAFWSVRLLVSGLPADIPRVEEIGVDRWVLAFTLVTGVLTSLVFGTIPAILSSRSDVHSALKTAQRSSSASFSRTASILVVGEVAVAVLLVIGAGLLIRSFVELLRVDPGFRTDRIVSARITPQQNRYGDDARRRMFYGEILARARAIPGVLEVEATSNLPLSGGTGEFAFEVEGKPYIQGTAAPVTGECIVTPGYLRSMGIPLLRGRALADTDRENTARVAMINEAMAHTYWPNESPVGKRFRRAWQKEWLTVVGVVGDVKYDGLASDVKPRIYRPFVQMPTRDMSLIVRTSLEATTLASSLREAVSSVDPTVPVSKVGTLDQLVSSSVAASRFTMLLLAMFATVALMLAAIGLYGVLAYAVTQRQREFGVRIALGAQRRDVFSLVIGNGLKLALIGVGMGLAGGLTATRLISSLLYGVTPTDSVTFASVVLLLVLVAVLASWLPARRAANVDPMVALRCEWSP